MKKVLLDECIPRKFKSHLSGYDCLTVPEAGWAGKQNGELLSLAENAGFQVFVSLDQGIEFQQNLTGRNIAVILLRAKSNRLADGWPIQARFWLEWGSSTARSHFRVVHSDSISTVPHSRLTSQEQVPPLRRSSWR